MDTKTEKYRARVKSILDFLSDKASEYDLDFIEGVFVDAETSNEFMHVENMCLITAMLSRIQIPDSLLRYET
ncbi:MAG: hypothetical protein Q4C71_02580 [Microbacteriaceae bacterium]|nr:hypothetical protein [Microbacteriaceae bacterium]